MQETPARYFFRRINETAFKDDPLPLLPVRCIYEPGERYAGLTRAEGGEPREIVLNFAYIDGLTACISTLAHEMIHAHCILKGIAHYADGHHLQGFMDAAEDHGLLFSEEPYINLFYLEPEELLPNESDTPTR